MKRVPSPLDAGAASRGYALSAGAFKRLAQLVHRESGIKLTEEKQSLVVSRLSRRLRSLGLQRFEQYCDLVEGADGADERQRMISSLTTNVTRFFREEHHFRQLAEKVLPPLVARARNGGRVRMWSAGCSSGEEPYSMAITLLDICPEALRLDIRILASDIDPDVIATARQGRYPFQAVAEMPSRLRNGFVTPANDGKVEMSAELRRLITFRQLNLLSKWPFGGRFDVIFCRNVVIYFDAATQDMLWRRYAETLEAGGHLFIGHSERLSPVAHQLFNNAGVTCYRRIPHITAPKDRAAAAAVVTDTEPEIGRTRGWA